MTERPDISIRDLLGTKTERLLEALAADDLHTWSELKEATRFSDRELRFHLAQLYSKKILTRRGSLYYLVSGAVEAYSKIDWRWEDQMKRARALKDESIEYEPPGVVSGKVAHELIDYEKRKKNLRKKVLG